MTKNEKIEVFIKTCFNELCLDFADYFSYTDDNGKSRLVPLLQEGKLNEDAVQFTSRMLGLSVQDIMTCNYDALFYLRDKYPYFTHYKGLEKAYEKLMLGRLYAEYKLTEAIAGKRLPMPIRCNPFDVMDRLTEQLKALDAHLPGTYHEGAEITDVKVSFQRICHYDGIGEFLESYLQMIERARVLFFQAIETDLAEDEICEYNFLVTVLGIRDFVCADWGNLYYDNLQRCREIYRAENFPNFYDYAHRNIGEALVLGQEILENRLSKAKSMLELVNGTAPQWQTECRWEALHYLRHYLEQYDHLHLAHKGPDDLFYPILISPPEGIQGIDSCLFYLNILWIENQIIAGVPDNVLEQFWDRLPAATLNQCEHLLINGIGKALLGTGIDPLVFETEEHMQLIVALMRATEERLKDAAKLLCQWLNLKDENACMYVEAVVPQLTMWIGDNIRGGNLENIFV